jgi:U4/U6.U5 tri-snRNP-associated protein 1
MGRSRSRSRDRYRDNRKRSRSRSRERDNNNNHDNRRSNNNNRDNNRNNHSNNGNDDKTKSENDNIVKALVTENDGEISCSIDETNRIRALLGLKPLNNEKPKEKQAVDNFKAQKEDEEKRIEAEKLKEQINKAKNKRLLNEKLKGGTLGEVDNNNADESLLSAADWVKRSRRKELTDKEKADLLEKRLLEEEEENKNNYSSKDLKGIQIRHSIKDFEAGESVILTLADTNVLDDNDNLNDEGPVLENVNMTDAERRKEREKKIKRSKLPAYVAYDDEEFDEPGNIIIMSIFYYHHLNDHYCY